MAAAVALAAVVVALAVGSRGSGGGGSDGSPGSCVGFLTIKWFTAEAFWAEQIARFMT